ncbi:MAG: ribosome silencing factor [Lentisphaerae bacterium GWF2_45_14]|nr:MAG: ribosome silencing factor [Lentisphaerae bacterium GWF2_45_14]
MKDAEKLAAFCATIADERKADNIVQLKLADISTVTDFFILCTANSEPHLRAIADTIVRDAREKLKVRPRKVDGKPASHWIIIDYTNVLIHIMTNEMRELYQLESLWGDAPTVSAIKTLRKKTPA